MSIIRTYGRTKSRGDLTSVRLISRTVWTQRGEILYEWNDSLAPGNPNILNGPPIDWQGFQRSIDGNEFSPRSGRSGLVQKLGFDHWSWASESVTAVGWAIPDWSFIAAGLLLPLTRWPGVDWIR